MESFQSEHIRSAWLKIDKYSSLDHYAHVFYEKIFEDPKIKALFSHDIQVQRKKLAEMLNNIINGAEFIEVLKPELISLGKLHKEKGVDPSQFDFIRDAFVYAAIQSSDNTLTEDEIQAWHNAFTELGKIMKLGFKS